MAQILDKDMALWVIKRGTVIFKDEYMIEEENGSCHHFEEYRILLNNYKYNIAFDDGKLIKFR